MLLTLNASCLKPKLRALSGGGSGELSILDLPHHTREVLGLRGLNLSTDLLAGAGRRELENIRERADKAGCSCLVLVEPEPLDLGAKSEDAATKALDRVGRVVQAAQILGCSSAAFSFGGIGTPEAREVAAPRLRKAVEKAERLDVNVLVAPPGGAHPLEPDGVTDLLKRVGGFRIGTLPDFHTASKAKDPVAYLRRLSPYALALVASSVSFKEVPEGSQGEIPPAKPVAAKPAKKEDPLAELLKGKLAPKGKAAKPASPPSPAPAAADDDDDDEELEGLDDEGEDDFLAAVLRAKPSAEPVKSPEPPLPMHAPYSLYSYVEAVASVGYDGPLAVDFRGSGDLTLGITTSRRLLQAVLSSLGAGG